VKKIREIFAKPIDRIIEEVIKVEQADEKAVLSELEEYIPTDYLREQFGHCNEKNCGDKCSSGPHCSGCWKSCVRKPAAFLLEMVSSES
jgi:hypothetical protein